eukprot:5663919-Prymnesium_polylepis.1
MLCPCTPPNENVRSVGCIARTSFPSTPTHEVENVLTFSARARGARVRAGGAAVCATAPARKAFGLRALAARCEVEAQARVRLTNALRVCNLHARLLGLLGRPYHDRRLLLVQIHVAPAYRVEARVRPAIEGHGKSRLELEPRFCLRADVTLLRPFEDFGPQRGQGGRAGFLARRPLAAKHALEQVRHGFRLRYLFDVPPSFGGGRSFRNDCSLAAKRRAQTGRAPTPAVEVVRI